MTNENKSNTESINKDNQKESNAESITEYSL